MMETTESSVGFVGAGQRSNRIIRAIQFLLLLLDAVLIIVTNVTAVALRTNLSYFQEAKDVEDNVSQIALFIIGTWLLLLALFRAYAKDAFGSGIEEYKRVLAASLTLAALVALAAFLFKYPISRGYYLLLLALGIPLLVTGRWAFRRVVHRLRECGSLSIATLVVGQQLAVDELVTVLHRERWLGYEVLGALTPGAQPVETQTVPVLGSPEDLAHLVDTTEASCVIFAEGAFNGSAEFRRTAWDLEDKRIQMIVVPALTDVSAQRLEVRPVAGLPLVHIEPPQALAAARWTKRAFDLFGAIVALIVFSPLMAVTAMVVKLQDGGPIFFRQVRTGRHGKWFNCLKFRSMVIDAEARKKELQEDNEGAGALFKIADDPRITKFGKFIRRFSIDELPQLFNVVAGQMSLVGPRPALPSEVAEYDDDVHRRLHVRPGLTGLWQVSGRSDLSWDETVRLDLYYVDNWSVLQDISILVRTVGAVFSSRGAY